MGNVISERLEFIGRIDDDGYVFDRSGNCMAKINNSGYIGKVGGGEIYGKIDEDGTIRNASGTVIGRIQADGYVYILSNRVCKVSSSFIERITPKAWNAGEASTYSGRGSTSKHSDYSASDSGSMDFLFSPFFIKLVIGIILGIVAMVTGVGGFGMLIAGPVVVFMLSFFAKIFG